jgi:hypothetical protein
MNRLVLGLGILACLAVATRTVTVRVAIVRAGYERAALERHIREEREIVRTLEADIAAASCPRRLLGRARDLGVDLVERDPSRIVVARPPAFAEDEGPLLVRR